MNSETEINRDWPSLVADRPSPFGAPLGAAVLRRQPEDFRVFEQALVAPTGVGEHAWLHIRKIGENTDWVARQLARVAGVRERDVGYAGLKDRWAVTEQWFSVHLPGKPDPDWGEINSDSIQVLQAVRHDRKLRRGTLRGNRFELCLRDVTADWDSFQDRIRQIAERGMPNYFGDQRFGRHAANLPLAVEVVTGRARRLPRHKRSLALSALRSLLFNRVLAERVQAGNWDRYLSGDVMQLAGRSALFSAEPDDPDIADRLASGEIHPTGPLWGRGRSMALADCADLEARVLEPFQELCAGLERAGVDQDRRALRTLPVGLTASREADDVFRVAFELPAGCFATVLLEQLVTVRSD